MEAVIVGSIFIAFMLVVFIFARTKKAKNY